MSLQKQIKPKQLFLSLAIASCCWLTACGDKADPGLSDEAKAALVKEADAKATGGACRHAGRALEDCYAMNTDAPRSAVFAGWKDMNDYMRENKMDVVKPDAALPKPVAVKDADASAETSSGKGKSDKKEK